MRTLHFTPSPSPSLPLSDFLISYLISSMKEENIAISSAVNQVSRRTRQSTGIDLSTLAQCVRESTNTLYAILEWPIGFPKEPDKNKVMLTFEQQ